MTLRNVRNNNPGNIDKGQNWQGLMDPADMNPSQKIEPRFCVFKTPAWGFRALAEILHSYFHYDGCKTITAIVSRWAPSDENNTPAYINDVAAKSGYSAVAELDLDDPDVMFQLVVAITSHETAGGLPLAQSFYPYWNSEDTLWGVHQIVSSAAL